MFPHFIKQLVSSLKGLQTTNLSVKVLKCIGRELCDIYTLSPEQG